MAYQSLYRKYRPQTFSDVMGQGHVTRTLQNALASGRVAHGYLFTGTRGTAKTTVARLLAKALNCESKPHPVAEPCNQCEACRSITAGSCIDVIELDAASHRGVADIEEVRKAVGYGPMQFRYKVFIIDEAHQLSSDAKDAFLKTLEEPPANVVFILATTEPQAIPITIRSRCQQFDFKRGSLTEITTRLRYVLESEGVTYDNEAITLVARGAEGSYRDSLSLLEQVLAFAPKHISAANVDMVLGTLDSELLSQVTDAVARRDAATAFALAGQLLDAGKEARTLLRTLSLHFRDLLLVSVGGPAVAAEMTQDEVQRLQVEAKRFSPQMMMKAMDALNEAQGETRWNNQHRLLVELTFLKLMNLGEEQGTNKAFQTAPIVFSTTPGIEKPVAVVVPTPALTPGPSPNSGRGESHGAAPVTASDPPADKRESPLPELGEGPGVRAGLEPRGPLPIPPTPVQPEEKLAPSYFADDEQDDDDEAIDEEDYATITPVEVTPAPVLPTPVEAWDEPVGITGGSEEDDPGDEEPVDTLTGDLFGAFDEPALKPANPPPLSPLNGWEGGAELAEGSDDDAEVAEPEASADDVVSPVTPSLVAIPAEEVPPPYSEWDVPAENGWADQAEIEEVVPESVYRPLETARSLPPVEAPAPPVAKPEPVIEEPPIVSVDRVRQMWPRFLQDAARLSKRTQILMECAFPSEVAGKIIVIVMTKQSSHAMMTGKPETKEFVRKLLARLLEIDSLGVRLDLDASVAEPVKTTSASQPEQKQRYDPIKAMDELDRLRTNDPIRHSDEFSAGNNGSDFGFSAPRSAPIPEPKTPFPTSRPFPTTQRQGSSAEDFEDGGREKFAIAYAEPLVQNVLQIFGGEVVE